MAARRHDARPAKDTPPRKAAGHYMVLGTSKADPSPTPTQLVNGAVSSHVRQVALAPGQGVFQWARWQCTVGSVRVSLAAAVAAALPFDRPTACVPRVWRSVSKLCWSAGGGKRK